jgi:hypothetical protein
MEANMITEIMGYVYRSSFYLISIAVFILLVGRVLPYCCLKLQYTDQTSRDRGLKKYKFPEGRAVLYETHPSIRRYVESYALFVKDGNKYVRCKIAPGIGYIYYALAIFDHTDKLIDVVKVNDVIEDADGYSSTVSIPPETSYVSFVLYTVNGQKVTENPPFEFLGRGKKIFVGCVMALSVIEGLILRTMVKWLYDILYEFYYLIEVDFKVLPTIIVMAAVGFLFARLSIKNNLRRMSGKYE